MELERSTAAGQRGPAESRAKPQGVRAAVLLQQSRGSEGKARAVNIKQRGGSSNCSTAAKHGQVNPAGSLQVGSNCPILNIL